MKKKEAQGYIFKKPKAHEDTKPKEEIQEDICRHKQVLCCQNANLEAKKVKSKRFSFLPIKILS